MSEVLVKMGSIVDPITRVPCAGPTYPLEEHRRLSQQYAAAARAKDYTSRANSHPQSQAESQSYEGPESVYMPDGLSAEEFDKELSLWTDEVKDFY